jgi:hypothetical protein
VSISYFPSGRYRLDAPPRDGWKVEEKIDLLSEGGHCENCGRAVRYLYRLRHPDRYDTIDVGSECKRRLTIRWRQNRNGNFVARLGRDALTVFRHATGFWQIAFRGRFSRFLDSAAEALALAYAFATGGA